MNKKITLVERGRGMQLSTSRVTVQDLVPYFQDGCSHQEIIRWIPTLTTEEIAVVESYYLEHRAKLDEEDRLIRKRQANRNNAGWVEQVIAMAHAERMELANQIEQSPNNGKPS